MEKMDIDQSDHEPGGLIDGVIKPRSFPVFRILFLLIAVALLVVSIYSIKEYRRISQKINICYNTCFVDEPLDLSKDGQHLIQFEQVCTMAHNQRLYLQLPEDVQDDKELLQRLKKTTFDISINDDTGMEIMKNSTTPYVNHVNSTSIRDQLILYTIRPFASGNYDMTIEPAAAMPELSGMELRLVGKYHMCGLEAMAVLVSGFIAFISGVPGLIIILCVAWITYRKRKAQPGQ